VATRDDERWAAGAVAPPDGEGSVVGASGGPAPEQARGASAGSPGGTAAQVHIGASRAAESTRAIEGTRPAGSTGTVPDDWIAPLVGADPEAPTPSAPAPAPTARSAATMSAGRTWGTEDPPRRACRRLRPFVG
jgi:hypothetical protein